MRCSIIVVTYNHREDIRRCLGALIPTLTSSDEVIVVDNASSDGTPDVVAREFPPVRVLANIENVGFGAACNQAAARSAAEYLVFLNPDTEPCAGWLDALLTTLDAVPAAGLATPKLLLRRTPELIDSFGHDIHISGIATCRGWGRSVRSHRQVEEVAAVSGACFAIRQALFVRLGGFDERLFLYYEDDDLSLRARMAGWRCLAVPEAIVVHDHADGFSANKLRYLERNRLWATLKLYRWSTLLRMLPVLLGAELLGWGMAAYSGPSHLLAKLRAWWDLVSWLPSLSASRARVVHRLPDAAILGAHRSQLSFDQVMTGRFAREAEHLTAVAFALLSPR